MLIRRYLLKEIIVTFFGVMTVVLFIGISNKLVRLISKVAAGEIAPDVLFQVIIFQIPELLAFLLPIGLFLAILLSYSRFYIDQEIPVMLACGVPWSRLLQAVLWVSIGVMAIVAGLTCYGAPKLAQHRERLLSEEGPMLLAQTVTAGRFHSLHQDKLVFYVAESSSDRKELKRIFIADEPTEQEGEDSGRALLTAAKGKIFTDPSTGATYLKLMAGQRYHGRPGEHDYDVLHFEEYQRLIEGKAPSEGVYYHRTMPTKMLWESPNASDWAELQWRLSLPISVPLLALLALPLSRVAPRAGRFSRILVALIICIFYFNLLTLSKRWVAAQSLAPEIGVWWVHGILLIIGIILVAHMSGRLAILWRRRR